MWYIYYRFQLFGWLQKRLHPSARQTRIRWQIPLYKLSLRRAAKSWVKFRLELAFIERTLNSTVIKWHSVLNLYHQLDELMFIFSVASLNWCRPTSIIQPASFENIDLCLSRTCKCTALDILQKASWELMGLQYQLTSVVRGHSTWYWQW